jgi:outer membrane protein assembly factor BamB
MKTGFGIGSAGRILRSLPARGVGRSLVARVSNLLYRRLPVGRLSSQARRLAGSKPAIQQVGNPRYRQRPPTGCEIGGLALLLALTSATAVASEEKIEQIVSREDPAFNCARAVMAVGRDGQVYLASGGKHSYVLRVSPDGRDKFGAVLTDEAIGGATANAQGVMASAHAHFAARVSVHDASFAKTDEARGFLVSDAVGWDAPAHVDVGASGDFYGLDQHRDRILRISPTGKVIKEFALGHDPPGGNGLASMFRVCEKTESLYVLCRDGWIRCLGFDGGLKWKLNAAIGAPNWDPGSGGFDVDDDGLLYVIRPHEETIKKFATNGQPAGEVKLDMAERKPVPNGPRITAMQLRGGEVFIKRNHPTEMFQRYELAGGKLKSVATADHERLTVRYATNVWTAGRDMEFVIDFDAGGRAVKPQWHVWLKTLGDTDWRELQLAEGKLQIPAGLGGICQVKVTPEVQPLARGLASEYLVQALVEVRQAGTRGSASVFTDNNRLWFGRGEDIPFWVVIKSDQRSPTQEGKVSLLRQSSALSVETQRVIATGVVAASPGETTNRFVLPAWLTAALKPGDYVLRVSAPGLSCASQGLKIGPGMSALSFRTIDYGDYSITFPTKFGQSIWDAPDSAAAHLEWARKLGFNYFVDRLGWNGNFGYFTRLGESEPLSALAKRLRADPLGVAPQKAALAPQLPEILSAYSAHSIRETPILLYMDAGLPLGQPFDTRKPEQMLADLETVTKALAPYPAFEDWDWASNWWVNQRGAAAAKTPEEKAAYTAAAKRANETGAWDPVLDRVADERWRLAVEAEAMFNQKLAALGVSKKTASPGPYRNMEAYPPVAFSNVDRVDLQAQFEQIDVPFHAPHSVDYYRRPGRSMLGHPEVWNDAGTGDLILPVLFQMVMRGSDSVGFSGNLPNWGAMPNDNRLCDSGMISVYRALNGMLKQYGPWLTTLSGADRVAIVAERRMVIIDRWDSVMPQHFTRLFEAYVSCLHAHRPATYVFAEDIGPDTLRQFKAVLLVDQRVELEPALAKALDDALAAEVSLFYDGTCRANLMPKGAKPLGVAFDKVEKDPSQAGDDSAYLRFPRYAITNAQILAKSLSAIIPPVAGSDNPEILMSERVNGRGHFLFVVNNTTPALEPDQMWRVTLTEASRVPLIAPVQLSDSAQAVYDVFAGKLVEPLVGVVQADLRSLPARIYASLPAAIASVELHGPKSTKAAQPFQGWVRVLDKAGMVIPASIPIRWRLVGAGGELIEERFASANSQSILGEFVAPMSGAGPAKSGLEAMPGSLALQATELFSGKTATIKITLDPIEPPRLSAQTEPPFPLTPPPLARDQAMERSDAAEWSPAEDGFGPHIRDLVVAADGKTLLVNAMNWDENLYCLDAARGEVRWSKRVGHYFAFAPQAVASGFAVQGFDFQAAEGYFLHLLDQNGKGQRRFALYGLPTRLPHRFVPSILKDRINNFAAAPDGKWVATAGDLGLAAWSRDGKLLWSQDWWKTNRHTATLEALDDKTLLVVEGLTASAFQASTGKRLWQVKDLAPNGEVRHAIATRDGKTVALLATSLGGRVFVLRDRALWRALPTAADDAALSPDGTMLAAVTGNQLKLYSLADGLQWIFPGDEIMRQPRFSPDGKRLAATSDLGSVWVLDLAGHVLFQEDLGAKATAAWLPNGDLVLGAWMGKLSRLDSRYAPKWSTLLHPRTGDARPDLLANDSTPTTRISSWGNAELQPLALSPNLLAQTKPLIKFVPSGNWGGWAQFVQDPKLLYDGLADPPPGPWLNWANVGFFAETSPINYVLIDSFRTLMRVNAITLFEDTSRPESFLRDASLDYWDAAKEQWVTVMPMLSNRAVHTHKLPRPMEAARWRIMLPWGVCGNLRLGEIVFHGEALGCSHPDVAAKRPLAVLFDDGADLADSLIHTQNGLSFDLKNAYAGNRSLVLNLPRDRQNAAAAPLYRDRFGHTIPDWDFEIVENPQPGQYRYCQLAWRGTAQTKSVALRLIGSSNETVELYAGQPPANAAANNRKLAEEVPADWQVVKIDLWEAFRKKPVRIQRMDLSCSGGPAWFDQIVLGRTEAALPAKR